MLTADVASRILRNIRVLSIRERVPPFFLRDFDRLISKLKYLLRSFGGVVLCVNYQEENILVDEVIVAGLSPFDNVVLFIS